MCNLVSIKTKLEECLSMVKQLNAEDRVEAGIIWNSFSAKLQMIINDAVEEEFNPKISNNRLENTSVENFEKYTKGARNTRTELLSQNDEHEELILPLVDPKVDQQRQSLVPVHYDLKSPGHEDDEDEEKIFLELTCSTASSKLDAKLSVKPDIDEPFNNFGNPSSVEESSTSFGENDSVTSTSEDATISIQSFSCTHINCDERFSSQVQLDDHVANSHKKSGKPYSCPECNMRFKTKGNFNVHMRRHSGERPYSCPKCTNRFTTSGNLRRHLLSHQGLKPYPCSECGARFTEKKNLVNHIRTHTGERPFVCTICNKRYSKSSVLAQHLATHNGAKPHLCHQCGKSFTQKSQLKLHEKRHSGVKPHSCHLCSSTFTTKSDLLRHEKTHSGEKSFVCDQCGKPFAKSRSLKEHLNKHQGMKPYACTDCNAKFSVMNTYYKHRNTKHSNKASSSSTQKK